MKKLIIGLFILFLLAGSFSMPIANAKNNELKEFKSENVYNTPREGNGTISGNNIPINRIIGNPNAPVTIEFFAEFDEKFSAKWYNETLKEIKDKYTDTGKAKIIFRHFPILSYRTDAIEKSIAAECASYQGYFFEFVDYFFNNLDINSSLEEYELLGRNLNNFNFEKFSICYENTNDNMALQVVNDELNRGINLGFSGVPSFLINDFKITGAQPFSYFEEIIEEELIENPILPDPDEILVRRVEALEKHIDKLDIKIERLETQTNKLNPLVDKIYKYLTYLPNFIKKLILHNAILDSGETEITDLGLHCKLDEYSSKFTCEEESKIKKVEKNSY